MAKKSKRNSGPRSDSKRAELLAKRRAEREQASAVPARPFAGLAAECDLVAMREFVPSATAPLPLADGIDTARELSVVTVLPGAVSALTRPGEDGAAGTGLVGMQVQAHAEDPGAELAAATLWAAGAEDGESLMAAEYDGDTRPVAEVLRADADLDITVHSDFQWWLERAVESSPQIEQAIAQANELMMPSARLEGVRAAWWVDAGERAHLRWVRPEDEDALMLALARVHAAEGLTLGEGSRFAGSFRAHGLLVPVFDLDRDKHPQEWTEATVALGARLDEALADDSPMTSAERRSRDGLRARQVTLR